jgi:hypothetical protein
VNESPGGEDENARLLANQPIDHCDGKMVAYGMTSTLRSAGS